MRQLLALTLTLSSCVVAHVSADGSVTALALGSAKMEQCRTQPPKTCTVVHGGELSTQAAGVLQSLGDLARFLIPGI